jgi:hypothetical protein
MVTVPCPWCESTVELDTEVLRCRDCMIEVPFEGELASEMPIAA